MFYIRFIILTLFLIMLPFYGCMHQKKINSVPQPDNILQENNLSENSELKTEISKQSDMSGSNIAGSNISGSNKSGSNKSGNIINSENGCFKKEPYTTDEKTLLNNEIISSFKKNQSILDEALDFCQVSQDFWQKGELENAIDALDQAYSLILSADANDTSKLIQQKEDIRFLISKRILEIYASRNIVVNGNHNAIPIVMNKHVKAEIDRFTKNFDKGFFARSYVRSGKYRRYIVDALTKAGLPPELSWLPLIESGFKVNALSKARALGLWQFIPSTGYKFGLKRNIFIDERLDPYKSTQAAIAYLSELHKIFGDWSTVLAAYNCGEGRVLRVIRSQNVNYLDDFWDLYERLPRETARYVPKFLATLHIINNLKEYGLDTVKICEPLEYDTVTVSKQMHLKSIAKVTGISLKKLEALNSELRYKIVPGESYTLKIPLGKSEILLAKIAQISVSYPPKRAYVKHRVKSGETLSTISKRYRVSMKRIARANRIYKKNFIVAGKILKIPQKGTIIPEVKTYVKPRYTSASRHVVKSGDSLWIIARRYGSTTKKIMALNRLSNTRLKIGQVLKIPGVKKRYSVQKDLAFYKVKRGDSPFTIAKLHNMSLERFLRINNLRPRNKIYPGQKLYVE